MKLHLSNVKMHLYVLEKLKKGGKKKERKKKKKNSVKTKMSGLEFSVYLASSRKPKLQN